MVRSYWKGTLVVALAWPGLLWAQQPPAAAPLPAGTPSAVVPAPAAAPQPAASPCTSEKLITVQESCKPPQKCRVLKCWCLPDGTPARDVQDVCTGEIMTILDCLPKNMSCVPGCTSGTCAAPAAPSGGLASRVYHWGSNQARPTGVPLPAGTNDSIVTNPKASSESGGLMHRWFGGGDKVVQAPAMTEQKTTSSSVLPLPTPVVTEQKPALPLPKPTQNAAVPAPKSSENPFLSSMRPAQVAGSTGKRPEAGAGSVKDGPAPPDASCAKPVQVGDACCAKPSNPSDSATAAASKPFQATGGAHPQYATGAPPAKPLVKSVDEAQPTDWRRSWGKPDAWQAAPPTQAAQSTGSKPAQDTSSTLPPAKPRQEWATAPAKASPPAPKWPETPAADPKAVQTAADPKPMQTVKIELPHADTKQPDPLMKPEEHAQIVLDKKAAQMKPAETKPAPTQPAAVAKAAPAAPAPTAPVAAAPAAPSTQPRVPLGAGSVLAAYANHPGGIIYLPVPVVTLPSSTAPRQMAPPVTAHAAPAGEDQDNAFSALKTTPGSGTQHANAFTTDNGQPEIIYPPNAMMSPQMQMQMQAQMQMASGPLPTNALSAGYAYRAPPQSYQGPMPPSPITQANYAPPYPQMPYPAGYGAVMPAYCPPAVPSAPYYPPAAAAPPAASPSASISGQSVQQLLLTMKDALYPSHREWAAEALVHVDWRGNPQVVDALLVTAREDPAATVRSGAVRALARMSVNTTTVVSALQTLKSDADPRVRQDVEQALANLGNPAAVQPVGGIVPK